MSSLRFVHTGAMSAALNMAVDDVLLDAARAGAGPILRTYHWQPPAVSLGYGQRVDEAIDVEACRALGLDLVRRTTGGRAVLHWNELTYSFHCAVGEGPAAHPLHESSRILGECLADGLRRFGVDAKIERGSSPAHGRSGACFASTARWELTCGGRKLVGSAQRRTRGALLQHGSILVGAEHLQLADLLPESSPAESPLMLASTHLAECVAGAVDTDALASCLAQAFADRLDLSTQERTLTDMEIGQAATLVEQVYGNDAYTFRLRAHPARVRQA
ncbi:MAG TPA: lipoate--protein ligase family protein [Candidatus Latescibacteria bacterium]|jgi:lipoate-protein ligase A|nr:lipoate--protein ligase family protein [Candidatus Latescibacterota bacterium]|tara:strand:+ start:65 stop:889 length:825 start_codon:yes stop_codon:yes gene_type:complete